MWSIEMMRGVLLDLDGTLVDHDGAAAQALRAWLGTLGVAATDEHERHWLAVQEPHFAAWREGRISFAEQRRRRLRDFLPTAGLPVDGTDLDRTFEGYLHHYARAWRAFDDAPAALAAIGRAGLRVAVLTNGTARQQRDKLARTGLLGRTGPLFTAEELGVAKPAADAFHLACRRWGLPPSVVLHVGDRHDLDVVAARAAGLRAVHLDRRGTGPADEPHRIGSLADLAGFLDRVAGRP